MKRTERRQLKQNPVALSVARMKENFERNQRKIVWSVTGVVVVLIAIGAYFMWRSGIENASRIALSDAMSVLEAPVVPPVQPAEGADPATPASAPAVLPGSYATEEAKLEDAVKKFGEVAEQYPSSAAGVAARYHMASALLSLGRAAEAAERFREVIARDGSGLYGDMARLGLSNALAAEKDYEAAIEGYRELSTRSTTKLPVDGILMELGRTYLRAGKKDEAARTFRRVVEEFPYSVYANLAQEELDAVKLAAPVS